MSPPEHAQPLVGIALKIISTLAFTAMATLIKLASARYPMGELVFFRSFFALVPVLVWVGWRGRVSRGLPDEPLRRATSSARSPVRVGMFCGFTALSLLPIADATAIGYAAPLMTVVLAVIFLGEKVQHLSLVGGRRSASSACWSSCPTMSGRRPRAPANGAPSAP